MALRFTPEENRELRRAVANFNKKINTLQKKGVTAALLPEKASVRDLKKAYDNRRDVQRRLDQLARFSARGKTRSNEAGIVGTDALFLYRKQEASRMARHFNRQAKKVSTSASSSRYPFQQSVTFHNLQAKANYLKRDIEKMGVKELGILNKNALTLEELTKRNENYMNNFIKAMWAKGQMAGVDSNTLTKLEEDLREIPVNDFYRIVETNPEFSTVEVLNYDADHGFILFDDSSSELATIRSQYEILSKNIDKIIKESNVKG